MKKTKLLALALAALMVLMLAACSASSSSTTTTTVSTSYTDENGNTTTNTKTTEVGASVGTDGVSTTNTTTTETTTTAPDGEPAEELTPEEEAAELTDCLYDLYTGGAKGTDEDGDVFYFAYNEDNDNLMIAMMTEDHQEFKKWHGYADQLQDGQPILTGYDEDDYIPFTIEQEEGENTFTMTFQSNGVVANMEIMDFDEFVEDLVNEWVYFD